MLFSNITDTTGHFNYGLKNALISSNSSLLCPSWMLWPPGTARPVTLSATSFHSFHNIETLSYNTALTPQHSKRPLSLTASLPVLPILVQVYSGRRAVVLANSVHIVRVAQTLLVCVGYLVVVTAHLYVVVGVGVDELLGQGVVLDQKEPVPVETGVLEVSTFVHGQSGCDVQQHSPFHSLGVVHHHSMRHSSAPVMSTYLIIP